MQERFLRNKRGAEHSRRGTSSISSRLASADQFKWRRTGSHSSAVWQCMRDWVGGRAHTQAGEAGRESGFPTPLSGFPEGLEPRACGVVAA